MDSSANSSLTNTAAATAEILTTIPISENAAGKRKAIQITTINADPEATARRRSTAANTRSLNANIAFSNSMPLFSLPAIDPPGPVGAGPSTSDDAHALIASVVQQYLDKQQTTSRTNESAATTLLHLPTTAIPSSRSVFTPQQEALQALLQSLQQPVVATSTAIAPSTADIQGASSRTIEHTGT
jgi:hypothetical protein